MFFAIEMRRKLMARRQLACTQNSTTSNSRETIMANDLIERIRVRAYEIWEGNGQSGDAEANWLQAEREILGDDAAAPETFSVEGEHAAKFGTNGVLEQRMHEEEPDDPEGERPSRSARAARKAPLRSLAWRRTGGVEAMPRRNRIASWPSTLRLAADSSSSADSPPPLFSFTLHPTADTDISATNFTSSTSRIISIGATLTSPPRSGAGTESGCNQRRKFACLV